MGVKDDLYLKPIKSYSVDIKERSKSQNSVSNLNVERVMEDVILWKADYYVRRRSVSFIFGGKHADIMRNYYNRRGSSTL